MIYISLKKKFSAEQNAKKKIAVKFTLHDITAVTTNTRPIAFKSGTIKLRFGGRQSKKSRWNYFESLQDSKATRQEIENFTSLREGKSCLN